MTDDDLVAVAVADTPRPRPRSRATAARDSTALATLTLPDLLARIVASGADIAIVEACLPEILRLAPSLQANDRFDWQRVLREALRRCRGLAAESADMLIRIAGQWSDWALVLQAYRSTRQRTDLSSVAEALSAQAAFQLGAHDLAEAHWLRRTLSNPDDIDTANAYAHLQAWLGFLRRSPPIECEGVRLEPLGHHHIGDFAWQYTDPRIAELCCLPTFEDDRKWHQWLDTCWGYGDQRLYAVIHPDWGFVGSVSLIQHGDLGFFYYWIGQDFRGIGLGPAAVHALLEDARSHRGMRTCYAKVFADNLPSRRALRRLGFEPLDFRAVPPDEREVFYRCGEDATREVDVADLRRLFRCIGSEIRIAVPMRVAWTASRSMREASASSR